MIGQRELTRKIFGQIERGKFPRFSILIGEAGSGKKLLATEIAKKLEAICVIANTKVDMIREIISMAYSVNDTTVYIIPDADDMSGAAANALLKVVEEPPKNAYFILTCENLDNVLNTIRSRGVTYMMEPYTYDDKCDYVESREETFNDEIFNFMVETTSNLGEIAELISYGDIESFMEYVRVVIENIAVVSGSNAFKIGEKLAFKDEEDKYNLRLFWKAFRSMCGDKMRETNSLEYANVVAITGDALHNLSIKGINKQMLFDTWLLDVRGEWM